QDDAVEWIAADQLLDGHRHQVPIEHRGRLDDRLAQRDHRDLDREAAGAQDAVLDPFRQVAQVGVAAGDLAPAVQDPDDRATDEAFFREALLPELRSMADQVERTTVPPRLAAQARWPRTVLCHAARLLVQNWFSNSSYDMRG